MASSSDVPLLIVSDNASSERRVTPGWTVAQLKSRLEPITGVPASCQRLTLKLTSSSSAQPLEAADEESAVLAAWPLQAYAEIHVTDTRPPGARTNYTDVSSVPKYEMSAEIYSQRTDSVLAWKKAQQLGRFDPQAPSIEEAKVARTWREVDERHVKTGARCRLLPDTDHRRGTVRFVGEVGQIPGGAGAWVGIALDEPTGKNDGSVGGARYFDCKSKHGVFVRAERIEVGDFPVLDDLDMDGDDEEF